jgi:hypothetical protein
VAHRPNPKRIHEAHRLGTLNRLIGEGALPERAEALVTAWEFQRPVGVMHYSHYVSKEEYRRRVLAQPAV